MSVSQSACHCALTEPTKQLLESVIEFYRHRFPDEPAPSQFLASRHLLHPELVASFELGYADRELGRLLPPRQHKVGRELRDRLQQLGVYRSSGHGHFNGSFVVPLRSAAGQLVNVYGRKTSNKLAGSSLHTWLAERCGLFNGHVFTNCAELILTDSVLNGMSFWCAEMPNVTCTFGLTAMHGDLVSAIEAPHIKRVYLAQRNTAGGDNAAAEAAKILSAMNVELLRVKLPWDQDANDVLVSHGAARLKSLVETAQPYTEQKTAVSRSHAHQRVEPTASATPTRPPSGDGSSEPAVNEEAAEPTVDPTDIRFTFDDRHYRVRGLDRNNSPQRLKINLLVERMELLHVDSLDFYSAQARGRFTSNTQRRELYVEEQTVKQDLAKILLKLEALQDEHLRANAASQRRTADRAHGRPNVTKPNNCSAIRS